jgi:hypothetical protein
MHRLGQVQNNHLRPHHDLHLEGTSTRQNQVKSHPDEFHEDVPSHLP